MCVTYRKSCQARAQKTSTMFACQGELKEWIYTQYDNSGLTGSIEAAPPRKEPQIKAKAVEGGRKKGDRGTTTPNHYMNTARAFMAKKFTSRVKAAIKKAAREATNV